MKRVWTATLGIILLTSWGCDKTKDQPAIFCHLPTGESQCQSDGQCNDGTYCNGVEVCEPSNSAASLCGCVRKANSEPCGADTTCQEAVHTCALNACLPTKGGDPDADGDGYDSLACGGNDCDDLDQRRYPGNFEVCDAADLDEDCNALTYGTRDADVDGFIDIFCCNTDGATRTCGTDCNDLQAGVNPIVPEVCNDIDDDCDGAVDEMVTAELYLDADLDGFGTGEPQRVCSDRAGYSTLHNDCDDTVAGIHPGAFRCTIQYGEYQLCDSDGGWTTSYCLNQQPCITQPGGWAICYPLVQ